MYTVSAAFLNATAAEARTVLTKNIFNSSIEMTGDGTDGSIIRLSHEEIMTTEQGLTIGGTGMSRVEITFYMPETPIPLRNGTVRPSAGLVLPDGTSEYVPLGLFYNTEITTEDDYRSVTVTAYDGMSRLERTYETTITEWPAEADAVLADIATQCGVTIGTITWPTEIPTLASYIDGTCREYVGWIAGLLGQNAKFNRDGELVFTFFYNAEISTIISRDLQYMNGVELLTDGDVTIQSLTSGTEEEPLTVGTGFGLTFYNPFMTQERLESIFANIEGLSYTPLNCKWRGNPALETGDVVFVETKDGSTKFVCVMAHTLEITGGMFDTISCYGQTEESYALDESPTQKEIRKAYSNLLQAIADASALINGAKGGIFTVTDSDHDGINDGWLIADSPDLSAALKLIRANYEGIGLSNDGGASYETAITADGINANVVTVGQMSAERIAVNGNTLSDYFDVSIDNAGHPVVRIGSSLNSIVLKQMNDRIAFYDTDDVLLAYWTNNSFEIINLEKFRLGNLAMAVQPNGSISFVGAT